MNCNTDHNFIAIDFETATSRRASICEVGIPEGKHHRAGDDAEMCARLYLKELEYIKLHSSVPADVLHPLPFPILADIVKLQRIPWLPS